MERVQREQRRDDHHAGGIRMERLADDLIGDVRAVVVRRIDVVHAGGDSFAQDGDGRVAVLRRTEDARTGEPHRAVAHPMDGQRGPGERKRPAQLSFTHGS